MARFLGLEPGGRSNSAKRKPGEGFGWALLRGEDLPLKVVKTGTVNDAKGAVGVFTDLIEEDQDPLTGCSIWGVNSFRDELFRILTLGICNALQIARIKTVFIFWAEVGEWRRSSYNFSHRWRGKNAIDGFHQCYIIHM
jgi:hypothetical protein